MSLNKYDQKHQDNINARARKVKAIIDEARQKAIAIAAASEYDGDGSFFYDDYAAAGEQMDGLMYDTARQLSDNIRKGNETSWMLSAAKATALVAWAGKHIRLPKALTEKATAPMENELKQFNARKVETVSPASGKRRKLNLSSRVWNLQGQFKQEMELAVDVAMQKGMSAADLAREVKKYLNDPEKLFRRVRDKSGALRLSKAAKAYHPGRGVYRSAYMNALRMAVTEINTAYREADYQRWQRTPFIKGIVIKVSKSNHVPDICDELAGIYPKDFKFLGWHPFCRCHAETILPTEEELAAWDGKTPLAGTVKDVPKQFKQWVQTNASRIAKAKTMPYFLKDNRKYWENMYKEAARKLVNPIATTAARQIKGYSAIAAYDNGGRVYVHSLVSSKDSDYNKLVEVADFFAKQGKEVRLTPKKQWHSQFDYDSIYGSLKGTKYYGKCPDLNVGGAWYEHEGFTSDNPKRAFSNMMKHGLSQSSRIVIDKPDLKLAFVKRSIFNRIKNGAEIDEVWLKEGTSLYLIYKKSEG